MQNFAGFRSLITTPGSLLSGIVMPANSRLGVSVSVATDPGDPVIDVNGNILHVPGGAADYIFRLDVIEENKVVKLAAGAPEGTVTLYVFDEWMRPFAIATS